MWKIGQSQQRIEDDALLRGEGAFTLDQLPEETLHMVVLRSPVSSAKITQLDVKDARAMQGVVDILAAKEQAADGIAPFQPRIRRPGPGGRDMLVPDLRPLADGLVQYVGHPVAVVIAETQCAAEDAAEAIMVDYEEREAVTDPLAAVAPDAPLVWPEFPDNICFQAEQGDRIAVDTAITKAAHVTCACLRISRVTAAALEPRAAIASFDESNGYRLEVGTQSPHRLGKDLELVFGADAPDIRVISRDTGGSFGMKNPAFPEYALALWAARRCKKPVTWGASRIESFLSDAHARDQYANATLALDADGRILGMDVEITAGIGSCLGPATTHPPVANVAGLAGVYMSPAIHVTVKGAFTNCQQVAPYRGAGRPEATYIIERMLDLAAHETGLDRVEIRRRNLIPETAMPHETPLGWVYDSGEFEAVLDSALVASDWAGFADRRRASKAKGKLRGIGIANPIEIAGGPVQKPHPEYAAISIAPQGNGRVALGSCAAGQGHETTFKQIVCDRLGLDPLAVEIISGDTGIVPQGTGTFGSRSVTSAGTSLWQVMTEAIGTARTIAAEMLNCPPEQLSFDQARYNAPDGASVTFLEAVSKGGQSIQAETNASAIGATFPNGCHICEVEIDPVTGQTSLERYTVVDDVGTVINPMLVKGQIAGGVAQGVGQALLEHIAFEEESGQLLTASFMDYAMPRAADLPAIDVQSHPVPTTQNPMGAKGAGEAGTVGGLAACISAVCDALSEYGIAHLDMPATPPRIWQAIQGRNQ